MPSMSPALAVDRIGHASTTRTIVLLHGIYGRGRNWQAIAKSLTAARPEYACWLVDLPHHGDSSPGRHGDTVEGLAADVVAWLDSERVEPDAILGHSFGGKVALAMGDAWRNRPLQIWVIDSTPETREPAGSAWDMLSAIRSFPPRFSSRDEAAAAFMAQGWSQAVAQWMTTNLTRDGDAFTWRLDFDAMERLLRSFFSTDLWSVVDQAPPDRTIHFVKASESGAMSDEAVRRAESLSGRQVVVHHLQGGHWIHAESPQAVVALLARELP
jgi:esterase